MLRRSSSPRCQRNSTRQRRSRPRTSDRRLVRSFELRPEKSGFERAEAFIPLWYHGFFEALPRPLAGRLARADEWWCASRRMIDRRKQEADCVRQDRLSEGAASGARFSSGGRQEGGRKKLH